MTARPKFGDAIEVGGQRPAWLPDGVEIDWTWDAHYAADRDWNGTGTPASMVAIDAGCAAIRLEVPRYDFVYLALERGMVPWFGGDEAPADWDGGAALFRNGEVSGFWPCGWDWRHDEADTPQAQAVELIGYTRKATSTALPLAHPAAPQGEDTVTLKIMTDKEAWAWADEHSADDPASFCATLDTLNKLGLVKPALAPAAIASGREGVE